MHDWVIRSPFFHGLYSWLCQGMDSQHRYCGGLINKVFIHLISIHVLSISLVLPVVSHISSNQIKKYYISCLALIQCYYIITKGAYCITMLAQSISIMFKVIKPHLGQKEFQKLLNTLQIYTDVGWRIIWYEYMSELHCIHLWHSTYSSTNTATYI